ncbi:protease [Halorubrum sp. SD690R]|uniref:M48 family metallopeptidase n=1 Tax=Halorubrum sp. SD690R TaxID=2518117 RepID=UPI0010F97CE4|nr:M48 family metalloprotease [Halorubrum sp. SD690R]TKX44873.1 protease [Halorubrum sp. SD690R]
MAIVGSILLAFYSGAVAVAWYFFGQSQSILALAIVGSILLVGVQYKVGKWAALKSVGAEDMDKQQHPQIYLFVEKVCHEKDLNMPSLKIADMGVPNAFAVGRRGSGTVVVSRELIQLLDRDELEGVLAHELAHIDNRDVITMQIGQGIASIVSIVAQYIVLFTGDNDIADLFLAIVVGNLVQLFVMPFVFAISRHREYVADADARRAIGSGDPLVRALKKIHQGNQHASRSTDQRTGKPVNQRNSRHGNPRRREQGSNQQVATLCISSPDRNFIQRAMSTHPPMEKRIQRLQS